jgi:hypothetical protein
MLKIAIFVPMPKASVSAADNVNPGYLSSWRIAEKMSLFSVRIVIHSSLAALVASPWPELLGVT